MNDGSATDGSDYVKTKGSIEFKPNVKMQKIKVEVKDDLIWEKDEDMFIKLLAGATVKNVCIGKRSKTKVVIANDDGKFFVDHFSMRELRCFMPFN